MIKFSDWIRLKEDSVGGGVGSAPSGASTSTSVAGGEGTTADSGGATPNASGDPNDGSTTSKSIATRPSVIGCGYCYPYCSGCSKCKKKKKRKKKGNKKK